MLDVDDGSHPGGPREACGVFGIYTPEGEAARTAFFALYALQHRGQESAGIATSDGRGACVHRGMGLVTQVFDERTLEPLKGSLAIGHTRYSTTGAPQLRNAQPYIIETLHGPLGLGHNGNLTNARALRQRLLGRGVGLQSSSDSELILHMLALPPDGDLMGPPRWEERIGAFMREAQGAYSLVVLTRDAIYAVRDPLGLRPLCLGELSLGEGRMGYAVASESCALGTIGARFVREVAPGEVIRLDAQGVHASQGAPSPRSALCVFEHVYFSRPDSVLEGEQVHLTRQRMGEVLGREAPADADVVVAVPDSAVPAGMGYARATGLPYADGLIKNRYIGRTFIQPDERLRRERVRLKYNPLSANLAGRRVVLVDDSIVRGNTCGPLVRLLREGGAAEVHVRISSPPVRHPCFMGVDMGTHEELIAHKRTVEQIRAHIGADSLAFLSLDGMMDAVGGDVGCARHCNACFSGRYPLDLGHEARGDDKLAFEAIRGQ
jgi:amidophosphoribosyltransferase